MRTLVLIGGGHSHAIALRLLGLEPLPDVRLILITNVIYAPYSGMLPGHLSRFYSFADCHIDLRVLAKFAQAEFILDEVIGLDLPRQQVLCSQHSPINFDWLAIDIGSTPAAMDIFGAKEYAVSAKPVPQFLAAWQEFLQQHSMVDRPVSIGIVGGGAGGVELALNLQGLLPASAAIHLVHRQPELMNSYPSAARKRLQHVLIDQGVKLHLNEAVVSINSIDQPQRSEHQQDSLGVTSKSKSFSDSDFKVICCQSGLSISCDLVIWVTQAAAPVWIKESGLATDAQGFILISDTLQSTSHPHIFATGDIATMPQQLRPKAGVFAVRQGQPLAANLHRITTGQTLQSFLPQQHYLSLIGLGDSHHRQAIAVWGNICTKPSRLLWWWKDRIDRRFMEQFTKLSNHV